jgi:hypothetical protein
MYLFLGCAMMLLNIKVNNKYHYFYVVISIFILIEYKVNGKLIHLYAPDSVVAMVYGNVGNYGLIFYSLMGCVFLINKKNIDFLFFMDLRRVTVILTGYIVVYSFISLYSFNLSYGSLNAVNAVNGHAYFLSSLCLLVFLFLYIENEGIPRSVKFIFLYNFIISLLIFKTRGVLLINICLFVFSFYWCRSIFSIIFNKSIIYKVAVVISFFILYILLFSTDLLSGGYTDSSLAIFSKEGSGKRDVAILEWALYIYGQYIGELSEPITPVFSPHSTYIGILGYIGVVYSMFFVFILFKLFHALLDKEYPPFMAAILSGVGVLFSVVFVSPLSNIPFLFILILMIHMGAYKPLWKNQ